MTEIDIDFRNRVLNENLDQISNDLVRIRVLLIVLVVVCGLEMIVKFYGNYKRSTHPKFLKKIQNDPPSRAQRLMMEKAEEQSDGDYIQPDSLNI